jgi:hypothetical protein
MAADATDDTVSDMHSKVTRRTFLELAGAAAVARRGGAQPNTQHRLEAATAGKVLKAPDGRTILGCLLVLRYRAVVADGRFPPGLLDELAAEWRAL